MDKNLRSDLLDIRDILHNMSKAEIKILLVEYEKEVSAVDGVGCEEYVAFVSLINEFLQ